MCMCTPHSNRAPRPLLSVALLAVKLEDKMRLREDELADRYRPPP